MAEHGLIEVPNPSEMLLAGRPIGAPGTCVACAMEGTRPVMAEVQALVARTNFNVPRRTADGFDFNRANLMLAVLEKRGGVNLGMSGEIRAVTGLQQRLSEASRTGFKTCIIPRHGTGNITAPDGMELLRVRNIREAIELVLS